MRVRPVFVWLLLGAVLVLALQSVLHPGAGGPSRDSANAEAFRSLLIRERARSRAASDANRALGARMILRGDSVRAVVRIEQKRTPPPPPDSSVTALDYWKARSKAAEVLLDLTVTADSIVQDSLGRALTSQLNETARLRALLQQAGDTIGRLAVRVAKLERSARQPCRLGDVAGGWDPLHGGAALVLGGSCNVWRLVQSAL